MIWRECEYCGNPFATYPSVVKLGRGRFCSKRCARYSRYKKRHPGLPAVRPGPAYESDSKKITMHCIVCGSLFQSVPSELEALNRQFCSKRCKGIWQTRQALTIFVCEHCGKDFEKLPGKIDLSAVYCSPECRYRAGRNWNDSIFDPLTADGAYILGFIVADGNLNSGGQEIRICQKEPEILERIAQAVHFKGELKKGKREQGLYYLYLRSKQAGEALTKKYGIPVGNKSYTVRLPQNIPSELMPHVIRGMFDGDGSAYIHSQRGYRGVRFSYCSGSHGLLEDFAGVLVHQAGCSEQKIRQATGRAKEIRWGALEDVHRFARYIYGPGLDTYGNDLYLERKKEKFLRAFAPRWELRGHLIAPEVAKLTKLPLSTVYRLASQAYIGSQNPRGQSIVYTLKDVSWIKAQEALPALDDITKMCNKPRYKIYLLTRELGLGHRYRGSLRFTGEEVSKIMAQI